MRRHSEAGIIGWVILAIFMCGVVFAACIAAGHKDDNSLGRVELISHHRDRCDYEEDCDDRGGGKQTCFMACYIVIPNPMPGGDQRPPPDEQPESLFPPTPDKIIGGIQTMGDAGIKLGSTIAQLVIDYVTTVIKFVV